MNISGIKSLCTDKYTSILIRTNAQEQIQIDIKNKNKDYSSNEEKFSYEEIKELSITEQINKIIGFYLKNNKLNYINDNEHIDRYEGKFFVALGTRNIGIQVPKNILDINIIKLITKKYIKDRYEFLNNNDINDFIIIDINKSSFNSIDKHILLNLKISSKGELLNFEKDFIINFIKNKLEDVNENIKITYSSSIKDNISGYCLTCDLFSIKVTENIYENISNIIIEHNNKINKGSVIKK